MKIVGTVISLLLLSLTACKTTFDQHGNFKLHSGTKQQREWVLEDPKTIKRIQERSLQLWKPRIPGTDENVTFVSQAAFISHDGYALATGHSLDSGDVFTFHGARRGNPLLRAIHWDEKGIEHLSVNGTTSLYHHAKFIPVRVVHRFEEADLAIVQTKVQPTAFFSITETPPKKGDLLTYGYNPIIHRDLRGLSGAVTNVEAPGPRLWQADCEGAAIFGDSGGPVIDRAGTLTGLVTGARISYFSWGKSKRVIDIDIEGVAASLVREIILADRADRAQATNERRMPRRLGGP